LAGPHSTLIDAPLRTLRARLPKSCDAGHAPVALTY
jgi:hypothetical protein